MVADVIAYTDGGCRKNPGGLGGWAFRLTHCATGHTLERAGAELSTTNNRMEMRAAIEALASLRGRRVRVVIRSDSKYLINCCSKWLEGWKARGWTKKVGPLLNVDLLQQLDVLLARHEVAWEWVRGHAGDAGNERVDALANLVMDRLAQGQEGAYERRFVDGGSSCDEGA